MGILIEYGILELFGNNGNTVCVIKYFINYVGKVKDIKCEEESEGIFHSGFRTDNESFNESEMNTF